MQKQQQLGCQDRRSVQCAGAEIQHLDAELQHDLGQRLDVERLHGLGGRYASGSRINRPRLTWQGGKMGSAPLEEGADARPGRHGHDDLHKRDAAERRWGTPACGGHRNQYRPARTRLVRLVAQGSKPGMRGQGPQPRIDHSRIIRVGGDAAPDHLEPTQDQRSEQGGCNSTKAHTTRANACRCSPADNMHRLSRPGSGDTARRSNRCDTGA